MDFKYLTQQANEKVQIEDLLDYYNIKKYGQHNYKCPFHNDKHPSASVKNGYFHCFTCNKSWNVVRFVQEYEHISCYKALQFLDNKFNLNLFREKTDKEKEEIAIRERKRQKELEAKKIKEKFINDILIKINNKIKVLTQINRDLGLTVEFASKRFYKPNSPYGHLIDLYFTNLKQLDFLEWLYYKLIKSYYPETIYDYIYPYSRSELLQQIYLGQISL